MKIRNGFVSNSSSCSFTLLTRDLTKDQIWQIVNYRAVAPTYGLDAYLDSEGWNITQLENALKFDTFMDGFAMLEYIKDYLKIDITDRLKDYYHSNG